MSRSSLRRWLPLVALPALLSACTGGYVVDSTFKPLPLFWELRFVAVDSNGNPTGEEYDWYPPDTGSAEVAFDPYAPTSSDSDGSGISNTKVSIPAGDYYIAIPVQVQVTGALVSPIFHHDYFMQSCPDHITYQTDYGCAGYYFQVFSQCSDWPCVNQVIDGTSSDVPPSRTEGTYRVIPLIARASLDPSQLPVLEQPAGWMQNDW
jgi:hypothetical protein